jgi:hypothetical protein
MKKSHLIALIIFTVTYLLPFRFAVLEVDANAHGLSTFGVFFSCIGIVAGIYFLIKDDAEKSHDDGHGSSHH